jgi:hypothetical protein
MKKYIFGLTNVSKSFTSDYIFEQTKTSKTSVIQFTNFLQRHDNNSLGHIFKALQCI